VYIRTTRMDTPVIYDAGEEFPIGGCKVLRESDDDVATVVAAGITLHEALAACDRLAEEDIRIRVVDLYTVKPVDAAGLARAAAATGRVIVVEDHHAEGGMADAVRASLAPIGVRVHSLAVEKKPMSGKPRELLDFAGIGRDAIAEKVRELIRR
jgi:transketolase